MPLVIGTALGVLALVWLGIVFVGPPYVPTHRRQLRRLFDELGLEEKDHVVDLGAGDGQVLLEAARRGASASGVELNPFLVAISRWRLRHYPRARVSFANIWKYHLPKNTTYVFVFFAGDYMSRLERYLTDRKTTVPLKVISYGFKFNGRAVLKTIGPFYIYKF